MELPDLIGPYKLLDRIGSGAMGEVFLARAEDGTMLAVKKLRPDLVADDALRARLRREVDTLAGVHSPHVAELVTADIEANEPYIAVRYVQGRPLSDQSTPAAPQDLWHIARGLAQAVHDIAAAGYVHRDLKPANVMITPGPPPSPVVIDFGIAHALDATRFSRHGRISGTPGYMAPELAYGITPGTPTDVYAWGATVAFAATARRAHWSQLGPTEIAKILYEITTLPAFRDLIEETLNRDPALRPTPATLLTRITALEPLRGKDIFRRVQLDAPTAATGTTTEVVLPGGRFVPVQVPAGSTQGTRLHLPSQGHPGKNAGPPGDLHIELDVHPNTHQRKARLQGSPQNPMPAVRAEGSPRETTSGVKPGEAQLGGVSPAGGDLRRGQGLPRPTRTRRQLRAMLGGALVAGGVISYALWPDSDPPEKRVDSPAANQSSSKAPAAASPVSSAGVFDKIPDSCKLVSEATLSLLVPRPKLRPYGVPNAKTCEVDGGVNAAKFLRVRARLVAAASYGDPIGDGKWSYEQDVEVVRKQHKSDSLINLPDLGDQAFYHRGLSADGKDVLAEVEARVLNVVIILSYQVTDTNLAKTEQVQGELTGAMREALASLGKP